MKSDLATFGEWCFLAGVFLMVTGDGLTNFNQPNASMAWPWLYLVPFFVAGPGEDQPFPPILQGHQTHGRVREECEQFGIGQALDGSSRGWCSSLWPR